MDSFVHELPPAGPRGEMTVKLLLVESNVPGKRPPAGRQILQNGLKPVIVKRV